ncbi:glutamate racemase, partial [Veillonellaceae bacterium M2-4]|nr:glutamate racemase [Veillonellaceae bacterium M2-4]
ATPQLAPLVEAQRDYAYNIDVVRDSLDSLKEKEFDTMVLGCTHYPIIEKEISKVVGSTIKLVDPADQVAQYTENVLKRDGMLAGKKGKREYLTTGDCQKFTEIARKWLDDPELVATRVETGEDL